MHACGPGPIPAISTTLTPRSGPVPWPSSISSLTAAILPAGPGSVGFVIRDLTDDEARAALRLKWGEVDDRRAARLGRRDGLRRWRRPVTEALHDAVAAGMTGYPRFAVGGELGEAYAGFAQPAVRPRRRPRPGAAGRRRDRRACGSRSTCSASRGADGDAHPGLRAPARTRRDHRPRAGRPRRSTPTPSAPSSTSTGSTRCSPPAPARCCSPSRTTRGAGCSPAPSSRACATSCCGTAPG